MEILGFIPARGGSKGIPGKNLVKLNGYPLIHYTIKEALSSRRISRLILSTEDNEIATIAKKMGAEIPFLRPVELAQDNSIIEDAIKHLLNELRKKEAYRPDIIALLHPTTPLRTKKHIDESIDLFIKSETDTVVSVSPPMEHPAEMVYFDEEKMKFLMDIDTRKKQRQQYPECYFINGAIYVFSLDSFEKYGNRIGERVVPYFMKSIESIDIDTMDDLVISELLIKHLHSIS
ncbi:MAG: cytidylyltransferase domain-containing protein [Candidatus Scalinduaceae bacterium]